MRWAAPLALALFASCDDPPMPAGALTLPRDGMLRAGGAQVDSPLAVFQARSAGSVAVEFDPEVPIESAARLLGQAGEAGLPRLEIVTGSSRFAWRFGTTAAKPTVPGVPPPPDVTRAVGEAVLVARPSKAELRVRLSPRALPAHAKAVGETAAAMAADLPTALTLVVEAPRAFGWSRVWPHVDAVSAALGDRVVRHELLPEQHAARRGIVSVWSCARCSRPPSWRRSPSSPRRSPRRGGPRRATSPRRAS